MEDITKEERDVRRDGRLLTPLCTAMYLEKNSKHLHIFIRTLSERH